MARATRETWSKRVERWKDSGLTAQEFASEVGINPRTLVYWKWRLGADDRKSARRAHGPKARTRAKRKAGAMAPLSFVEVEAAAEAHPEGASFEVELPTGIRIRMAAEFDAEGLGRLLDVLEERG